jgi:hypothetical protein
MTVVSAPSRFSDSVHVRPESSITSAAESPSVWVSVRQRPPVLDRDPRGRAESNSGGSKRAGLGLRPAQGNNREREPRMSRQGLWRRRAFRSTNAGPSRTCAKSTRCIRSRGDGRRVERSTHRSTNINTNTDGRWGQFKRGSWASANASTTSDNDKDRYELESSVQASRRGGRTKSPGSKPIAENGLPVCVLPRRPSIPDRSTLRPDPDGTLRTHFHAVKSRFSATDRGGARAGGVDPAASRCNHVMPFRSRQTSRAGSGE